MAENSKIEWTHHTFNPWRGCTKVSPGCANCYAETFSGRNPAVLGVWGPNGTRVVASEAQWREPLKWNKAAAKAGERHRVFCASLADVFEGPETMPADAWDMIDNHIRYRLWATIWLTPHLDWLLLTKRPENVRGPKHHIWAPGAVANATAHVLRMAGEAEAKRFYSAPWPPPNVWLGASVENQAAADERIPHLLATPAAVRFLSCEPLLGAVDLVRFLPNTFTGFPKGPRVDWVIVGGESGPCARPIRPMHPMWARSLRDQCQASGVAFHFKQWGEYSPDQTKAVRFTPVVSGVPMDEPCPMFRVGKGAAGRLLDGRTWDELPAVPR